MARITEKDVHKLIANGLIPTARAIGLDLTGWVFARDRDDVGWVLIDIPGGRYQVDWWATLAEAHSVIMGMIAVHRTVAVARS